jgi:tellurite resistance protein
MTMSLFPEIQLDHYQAEAIARGLFAVAKADGIHEREAALVASFWADTGGSAQSLSELERRDAISDAELSTALSSKAHRQLFLKTAVLLSFADGTVSDKEKEILSRYAGCLGLSEELPQMETEVKEYLLGHLSHIHNVEAVAEVAKKLAI